MLPDADFVPIENLVGQPIRASEWLFVVEWSDGDAPRCLRVDDTLIRQAGLLQPPDMGRWHFSLPPTVRDLARIEVESYAGKVVVGIVAVVSGYQLPEPQLKVLLQWLGLCREVWQAYALGDQMPIMDLVDASMTLPSDTAAEEQKEDVPEDKLFELTRLLDKMLKAPLSRLMDEQHLVDPGEIQRITSSTVDYFIHHPETWRLRTYVRPQPVRLLDERSTEDFDVYENRFVLYFLNELDARLAHLIARYDEIAKELSVKVPEMVLDASRWLLNVPDEELDRLQSQLDQAEHLVRILTRYRANLRQVRAAPMFNGVHSLNGSPRPNTTLRLHPIYGKLYRLYEEIRQGEFSHKRIRFLDDAHTSDLNALYGNFCLVTLLRGLKELGFVPSEGSVAHVSLFRGDVAVCYGSGDGDGLRLEFVHGARKEISARVTWSLATGNPALDGSIHVELSSARASEPVTKTDVWLMPDPSWWGSESGNAETKRNDLRGLYARLESTHRSAYCRGIEKRRGRRRERQLAGVAEQAVPGTLVVLHPTAPGYFDDSLGYSDLRLLLNQGDNFTSDEDYRRFGGYRVGCLPVFPSHTGSDERSLTRLKRMVRIQLFRIGVNDLCLRCNSTARGVQVTSGMRYTCPKCNLSWGEVRCHCGMEYMKIVAPRISGQVPPLSLVDVPSAGRAVAISEAVEGRWAIASACEALDHLDDIWVICPYCGHCEKEHKSAECMRCKTRNQIGRDRS
jgi:hypothetical protein